MQKRKQIIIATNAREKLAGSPVETRFYVTWCGLTVKELQQARDRSNVIFLCPMGEAEDEDELKKLALYLRDLCIEDEKILYIYGAKLPVDLIHSRVPDLYVRMAHYTYQRTFSLFLEDLAALDEEMSGNLPTLLMMDDDTEYIAKLRVYLEGRFRILVNHFDLSEAGPMILRSDAVLMGTDISMTLLGFTELFQMLYRRMRQPGFHLYYISSHREERDKLNAINARSVIAFTKDMEVSLVANYLIRSLSGV